MSEDDLTQVRVSSSSIGVVGLKAVIAEVAEVYGERPDREVKEELLNRLGKRNYIPEIAKEEYGRAFLREFKKSLGKPFEEEPLERLEVKVLGSGCYQCDKLEQDLLQVMAETGIVADIEHVRDIKEIGEFGVTGTPALLINRKVKSVGSVPPKSKLIKWSKEADSAR